MSATETTVEIGSETAENIDRTPSDDSPENGPASTDISETRTSELADADEDTSELDAAIEKAVAEATDQARRENGSLTQELSEVQSERDQLRTTNEALGIALNRLHVSIETGVPTGLLSGETREQIEVSAAALKSWKADKPIEPPTARGALKSGANLFHSSSTPTAAERAAQLLRDGYR